MSFHDLRGLANIDLITHQSVNVGEVLFDSEDGAKYRICTDDRNEIVIDVKAFLNSRVKVVDLNFKVGGDTIDYLIEGVLITKLPVFAVCIRQQLD